MKTLMHHAQFLSLNDPHGEHVLLKILSDVFAPLSEDVASDDNSDYPRVQATLEMKAYLKEESTEEAPLEW